MRAPGAPLHRTAPKWERTNGDIAASVGADLGLRPDAEQQWLLDAIYGETVEGLPAAYEVCVVAPRQNLKSAALEMAALTDLYVVGVDLAVWTAHEFKTARKSFEDMRRRIMAHPDYAERTKFRDSHGEEAIMLDSGERLEFHARSGGSGRGFTCRRITLDEAMYLQPGDLGALVPTMFTIEDAQIRYGSSAGKVTSGALRALRERGRMGDSSLAYVEYGATPKDCEQDGCPHLYGTPGCALDDRDLWWQSNCALWAGRATLTSVEKQRKALPPEEFAREFLSWWEDPAEFDSGLSLEEWRACLESGTKPGGSVVFAVDIPPDQSSAAVAVGSRREDGRVHVEIVASRRGTGWVVPEVVELCRKWNAGAPILDASGPAKALLPAFAEAGLEPQTTNASEMAQACGAFYANVVDLRVVHDVDTQLDAAVISATTRPLGDGGWAWSRKKSTVNISPLVAVTLAAWGAGTAKSNGFNIW